MADIDVTFATNADTAAAQIDNAERSTAKAGATAENFNRIQEKSMATHTIATKVLRGAGLAAGLMGAEFGGAIGKVAGLGAAGAAVGGPWGAAIGVAMGIASAGIKALGSDSEEAKERLKELTKELEKAGDARLSAEGRAAGESSGINSKHGKALREALGSGEDPQQVLARHKNTALDSDKILQLKQAGFTDSEIEQTGKMAGFGGDVDEIAQGIQARARNKSGLFGEFKSAIAPRLDPYGQREKDVLDSQDKVERDAELKKLNDFLGGRYAEAVENTAKAAEGTLEILKKAQDAEGAIKVKLKDAARAVNPRPVGSHWSRGGWGGSSN